MALFYRIKEVKSINIFNHFKRFYFQNHTPRIITNHTNSKSIFDYYNNNSYFQFTNAPKNQLFHDSRVRFFAAPVQFVKKKEDVVKLNRPRLNDEITSGFVRLVSDEGHNVVSLREALRRANELEFDLVEVDGKSDPPVCRLMDYNKEMYNKKVKGKERAKLKASETLKSASKEVRLSVKAEHKDIKIKADTVKRLMERGYRVKCTALAAKGKNTSGQDLSGLLSTLCTMLGDVAVMEVEPKVDEKQGYMIVRHIKFGSCKKGKKGSKGLNPTNSDTQTQSSAEEDSESDLDDEVKTPLQSQTTKSPSRISHDKQNKFETRPSSTIRSDSQAPSVSPSPQPENRYAKKVPINASPNIGSQPQPQPENRYAKKAPINPLPNIESQPQPQPENRYAKKTPINALPNIGSQPQPQPENRYAKKVPSNPLRTPNIGSQPQTNIGSQPQMQPQPRVTGNSTPKSTSFGIFSGEKTNNVGPGVHVNQQVTGKPNPQGNINSPAGDDKNKKFGIFSG